MPAASRLTNRQQVAKYNKLQLDPVLIHCERLFVKCKNCISEAPIFLSFIIYRDNQDAIFSFPLDAVPILVAHVNGVYPDSQ